MHTMAGSGNINYDSSNFISPVTCFNKRKLEQYRIVNSRYVKPNTTLTELWNNSDVIKNSGK